MNTVGILSALGAVAAGAVLGVGLTLVFRRTQSITARILAAVFALGLGLMAARLVWPKPQVFPYQDKMALVPDWTEVTMLSLDLTINSQATLLPGVGTLWVEKAATSRAGLQDMRVTFSKAGDKLTIVALNRPVRDLSTFLSLQLGVPTDLEQLEAVGPGSLYLMGLALPKLRLRVQSARVVGCQIGKIEVGLENAVVHVEETKIREMEVYGHEGVLFLTLKGLVLGAEGTIIRSARELLAELWLTKPFRLEVVVPPGGQVEVPPLRDGKWENLPGGTRIWSTGDPNLAPIRIEVAKGRIKIITPNGQ